MHPTRTFDVLVAITVAIATLGLLTALAATFAANITVLAIGTLVALGGTLATLATVVTELVLD